MVRIIPARAGFTGGPSGPRVRPADHPRSRGVYCAIFEWAGINAGSSPLARGLRVRGGLYRLEVRIIPARAGFTFYDNTY